MKNLFTPPLSLTIIIAAIFLFANQVVFAQSLTVTLTASDHNDYNISCFGMQDGSITANATGGTAPYTYQWSNEQNTQTIADLAAGYYRVIVRDYYGASSEAEITLVEPIQFRAVSLSVYTYSNNKNVSCFICNDGSIATSVENGIAPYTFEWTDGPSTQDRTNLFAGQYTVIVTDANGCTVIAQAILTKPDRDDWQQNGNAGTNPSTQYIGTSDNKDFVFRTNASERLRIKSNGQLQFVSGSLKIETTASDSARSLYVDPDGVVRASGYTTQTCYGITNHWVSNFCPGGNSNDIFNRPFTGRVGIGTIPTYNLHIKGTSSTDLCLESPTGSRWVLQSSGTDFRLGETTTLSIPTTRFTVLSGGQVGIGTTYIPANYMLAVKGNVISEKVYVQLYGSWPDYVFKDDYKLMPLTELESFIKLNKHLPDMPSAEEVEKDGHDLGDIQTKLLKQNEELTLHIIELNKRIDDLESKISKK